jgi:hypothetical protein
VPTENEVVIAMCAWLRSNGYDVGTHRLGTHQGYDIEASKGGRTLYVECKGGASKVTGKPFGINYQWQQVSGAFFNQVRLKETHPEAEVGIALPHGERYPALMADLKDFCAKYGIRVFWLSGADQVSEW